MSTIQQLKNFIRHGKQARVAADDASKNPEAPPTGQAAKIIHHHAVSDPAVVNAKSKRIDESKIAKLVAEENESKSKFPKYPALERWQLLEKMGDGAFSNVYRAKDRHEIHGEVAIKVVRKYEMNSLQRANILKEVQIMRQLDHPNIVKLIEFSESKEFYYIVLELAPGGELFHQIVRLTYFSEDLSRHVITQVAKALEYLHEEKGVVHRDIKPENILFSPIPFVPAKHPRPKQPGDEDKVDEGEFIRGVGAGGIGRIKIADFGLSKVVWESQTMTPCGTVGYTAPEIVKDERYSKSVDMWALGCVLYTLLCGFPPFYDESIETLTEKVAKGQYTFLSPWWDDISKSAQELIRHLLTVDPDKRYTIKEFLAHPWIRQAGPTPREEKKNILLESVAAYEVGKVVDGENKYDFRSPAAVNLREVFDVSYAVHRQEEEAKMRKQLGIKVGGPEHLSEVTEADEEQEGADVIQGQAGTKSLETSMRNTNIRDQDTQHERGRERTQAPAHQQEKGYGQHSAAVAAAARQQVRERQKQKGAFELSLDGATLLGRRGMKPATRVGGA
ncbi:hypothetical protein SAPIO_CDS1329 [Scedosporium apiospermum]|uniref:Protein kinase domain-containing protein n=1 Tax=Pseudallescheria apiosperma TaxID=563466 RepID=A0A084GF30_PSEDA|nr:uncharacterized protein SAPIO_CDS1329 [Scedosporium apiospermum]KEZ45942.1 hypothetical protein SAPIO_CDS1329 [Scedosporium apiospermum]